MLTGTETGTEISTFALTTAETKT